MTGLSGLVEAAQIQKERQAARQENFEKFVPWAKFTPNHPTVVRFLEQGDDVAWCWIHELPKAQNQVVASVTPCLNQGDRSQACPGCETGVPKKIKGWISLIMRDAPLYEKDSDGRAVKNPITQQYKTVGTADQVFLWSSGPNLFTNLGQKDVKFKGLMSRDFEVVRTGSGTGTVYSIEPYDADGGPQPMSEADFKLAADKPDTKKYTIPETYEVAKQLLQGVPLATIRKMEDANASQGKNVFGEALAASE